MTLLWLSLFGQELWSFLSPGRPALPTPIEKSSPAPLPLPEPLAQDTPVQPAQHPKGIVIVIDDMGESLPAAQDLLRLPFPVVLSIWPHSRHARQTAELAYAAGREVFIHLPMQPVGPARRDVGPDALMAGDSPERIARLVEEARRRVPHAVGLNNHMGSRATSHAATAERLCDVLAPTGLVVLDSVTHPASLLYSAAHARALPALRRHIFLDHTRDRPAVLAQLEKARRLAHVQDVVVVIGHPHAITLEALRQWGPPPDVTILTALGALGEARQGSP